jgi:hypothetical protein
MAGFIFSSLPKFYAKEREYRYKETELHYLQTVVCDEVHHLLRFK